MRTLKIDNDDLVLDEQKNFVMVQEKEEEQLVIQRVLSTGQGEWFLNVEHGLAYEELLGKTFDEERARLAILEAIYQEPRAESVESIEFERDRANRKLVVKVVVKMLSGAILEEVIPLG